MEKNRKQPENVQSGALINKQIITPSAVDFGNSSFLLITAIQKRKEKKILIKPGEEDLWKMTGEESVSHQAGKLIMQMSRWQKPMERKKNIIKKNLINS